jgi:hypothetical protein
MLEGIGRHRLAYTTVAAHFSNTCTLEGTESDWTRLYGKENRALRHCGHGVYWRAGESRYTTCSRTNLGRSAGLTDVQRSYFYHMGLTRKDYRRSTQQSSGRETCSTLGFPIYGMISRTHRRIDVWVVAGKWKGLDWTGLERDGGKKGVKFCWIFSGVCSQ